MTSVHASFDAVGSGSPALARPSHAALSASFAAAVSAALAVISTRLGQWSVGVQPGFLLATEGYENPAIVLPVTFGFHAY